MGEAKAGYWTHNIFNTWFRSYMHGFKQLDLYRAFRSVRKVPLPDRLVLNSEYFSEYSEIGTDDSDAEKSSEQLNAEFYNDCVSLGSLSVSCSEDEDEEEEEEDGRKQGGQS